MHVTKILDFIFSLTPVKLSERQRKIKWWILVTCKIRHLIFSMSLSTYVASTGSATGNYSSVTKWCLPGARVLVSRELSGPGMRAVAVVPAGISTVHSNLSPVRFQLLTIFP